MRQRRGADVDSRSAGLRLRRTRAEYSEEASTTIKQRYLILILAGLAALLAPLSACGLVAGKPELTYTMGECDQSIPMNQLADWAKVEITAENGVVHIRQNINYVCCADIKVVMKREGNVIKLIETNRGQVCKCMCGYQTVVEIKGLPKGEYMAEIWGVEYQDVNSLKTPVF